MRKAYDVVNLPMEKLWELVDLTSTTLAHQALRSISHIHLLDTTTVVVGFSAVTASQNTSSCFESEKRTSKLPSVHDLKQYVGRR